MRRFYESKGFFDARVGRKLVFSPDNTEVQVNFLVEEGRRYIVDRVTFKGNTAVSDAELRAKMNMLEGRPYDEDVLRRDLREMIRAYSPYGYIYQPQSTDPNYLQIGSAAEPVKPVRYRIFGRWVTSSPSSPSAASAARSAACRSSRRSAATETPDQRLERIQVERLVNDRGRAEGTQLLRDVVRARSVGVSEGDAHLAEVFGLGTLIRAGRIEHANRTTHVFVELVMQGFRR